MSFSRSDKKNARAKPQTAEELRQLEYDQYTDTLLASHGGYLSSIIKTLSTALETSTRSTAIILGAIYFALHLITPAFLLPHLSALITLVLPIKATLTAISLERTKGVLSSKDGAQWCFYWAIYCLFEFVRGWVGVWRPGWKAIFEVTRTTGLIVVGGPWFGAAGLRPPGPSDELKKMEKLEEAKQKGKSAKEDQEKAKQEKAQKAKKVAEAKAKAKQKDKPNKKKK